jgi:NodT family efflux transporter outer membrane factor (OMF) lipoprotein
VVFLSLLVAAGATVSECGCTSLSEYVHNCFKVGPNYHQPPAPLSEHWIDEGNPRVHVGNPNLCSWWDVFDDPILTKLLHDAYAQNLTVRQAGIQILQAKIQKNIACSELLPQAQDVLANITRGEVSRNNGAPASGGAAFGTAYTPAPTISPLLTPTAPIAGAVSPVPGAGAPATAGTVTTPTPSLIAGTAGSGGGGVPSDGHRFFTNFAVSANLAWELDFWGLFRRNLEAADASLDQAMQNYDEIVLQLLANVATQYVELRTLQKRLQLARQNVAEQEPIVALARRLYEASMTNSKPVYFQQKSNLDNTRALIPPLEAALRQANNALCVLLGMPVHDLVLELGDGTVPDPQSAGKRVVRIPRPKDESVVVGIPGELLLRRPDVLALEDQLRVQSAQIGIAEAEMYPHIGINGSIGLAANRLGRLFDQQSWTGSMGPSLTWNILQYGRLLANVRFQNNQYKQYVLAYQQGILNANEDAENSLVSYLEALDQHRYLQSSADAAATVTEYYLNQLAAGFLPKGVDTVSYSTTIFTAVNFKVTQQDLAAQAEGNIALNLILLYRAMGGGWQIRLTDPHGLCADVGPDGPSLLPIDQPATSPSAPPAGAPETLPPPRPVPAAGPDGKRS